MSQDPRRAALPAAALVAVEGVALVLLGLGYAVAGALGRPEDRLATELAAGLGVLLGVALLAAARGLRAGRSWVRTPVVLVQVFALPVGWSLVQGHVWLPAVAVLGLAVGVLVLLATPGARAALRDGPATPR